ncbi:MAG: hypothetical protein WCY34_06335 [Candidatus Omnitrophota bacterium]|jgi:hypothetical protein
MNKGLLFTVLFLFFPICFSYSQPLGVVYDKQGYVKMLKEKNPKLYEFEKRIVDIQREMDKLLKEYDQAVYDEAKRSQIKEQLKSLLKENMDIRNDFDYQVEKLTFSR